jgi:hypothetical protein
VTDNPSACKNVARASVNSGFKRNGGAGVGDSQEKAEDLPPGPEKQRTTCARSLKI